MEYVLHLGILIAIFAILSISLDLLIGETGLLSMAHAAFFGIGAYASALASANLGASFGSGLLIGMSIAALTSLAVSLPTSRLHDDYFAIATFAFQIIIFSIFNNWVALTRGPLGVSGIPSVSILGWVVRTQYQYFGLTMMFAVVAYIIVARIASSPFGRVLRAIREDEVFAQAQGKNALYFKVTSCAVSAALAASAGSLYAHHMAFVDPTTFTIMDSILIVAMVVIGGAGSRWGAILGALLIILTPEALRFLGLSGSVAANLRLVVYGSLLVALMLLRPQGLLGRYRFGR